MKNILIVISGPSGVGKGTVARRLLEKEKTFALSISCTTREKRLGEENKRHYFFVSDSEFQNKIDKGDMLEYSKHFGHFYGTQKSFVLEKLQECNVMLEIDVNGGLKVKDKMPNAVLIMVVPPSFDELKNRLINRKTESIEKINERLSRVDYELEQQTKYDYVVLNDTIEQCVERIEKIIEIEKNKI